MPKWEEYTQLELFSKSNDILVEDAEESNEVKQMSISLLADYVEEQLLYDAPSALRKANLLVDTNFNTVTTAGFYYMTIPGGSPSNAPSLETGIDYLMLVMNGDDGDDNLTSCWQFAVGFKPGTSQNQNVYYRVYNVTTGGWNNWAVLVSSSSGSSVDKIVAGSQSVDAGLSANDFAYYDSAANEWKKASAGTKAPSAIFLTNSEVVVSGKATVNAVLQAGTHYFWDTVSGAPTTTVTNYYIGFALSSSTLLVNFVLESNDILLQAGFINLPSYTDNVDGTITINETGIADFFDTADGKGKIIRATTPVSDPILLTDMAVNYLYISYNSGSPVWAVTLSPSIFLSNFTLVPAYRITREGTELHTIDYDEMGAAGATKMFYKDVALRSFERQTGLVLTTAATRVSTVTAGLVWFGGKSFLLSENKAGVTGELYEYYLAAGIWQRSLVTQYDAMYYSDGTNRCVLGGGNWVAKYFYRGVEDDNHTYYFHGNEHATDIDAFLEARPVIPDVVSSHAIYVGKIVVQKSATNGIAYPRVWGEAIESLQITKHNDLTNRDDPGNHNLVAPLADGVDSFRVTKADGATTVTTWNTDSSTLTHEGTLVINGDIIQNGSTYETHAQQLYTKNDYIVTREDAVVALPAGELSGIQVSLYDGASDLLFGTDKDGYFKVGEDGALQILATREDTPLSAGVAIWNDTIKRFDTKDNPAFTDENNNFSTTQNIAGNIDVDGSFYISGNKFITAAGSANNFIGGVLAGETVTTDLNATIIGYAAGNTIHSSVNNTIFGFTALEKLDNGVTGHDVDSTINRGNTALGTSAGRFYGSSSDLTLAKHSIFIGYNSKASANDNENEIVIGYNSLGMGSNTITLGNTTITDLYIGSYLLCHKTGSSIDIFLGGSPSTTYSGSRNTTCGVDAGNALMSGSGNTLSGLNSGLFLVNGNDNTACGDSSLGSITDGSNNVALGEDAGRYYGGGVNLTLCNNSIFIGSFSRASANGNTNEIVIGYNTMGNGNHTVTLGNDLVNDLYLGNDRVPTYKYRTTQIPIQFPENHTVAPDAAELYTNGTCKKRIRNFSGTTSQALTFDWSTPYDMDTSKAIQFRVKGIVTSEGSTEPSGYAAVWGLGGYAIADDADANGTYPSGTTVTDSIPDNIGDVFVTPWSSDITVSGLTNDTVNQFLFGRETANASDTFEDTLGVIEIEIRYAAK